MRRVMRQIVIVLTALSACTLASAQSTDVVAGVVEVRSYNLKPGTRDGFHERLVQEGLPMLQRWHVDVVAYGPSLHDRDSYYLIRAFPGLEERQRQEDAFYGSAEWRNGLRDAVLADIESYTTVVVRLDAETLRGLRASLGPDRGERTGPPRANPSSDLDALLTLNQDYIRSVQTSDVKRFGEILANDFRCSLADGSFVDKRTFIQLAAQPATISNLEAHDVEVQLLGEVAIVHGRTTFTTQDGQPGSGRYTDVWARRNGRWLAVSAHVTRR
jgi:ketosteroid isomerase-like protein